MKTWNGICDGKYHLVQTQEQFEAFMVGLRQQTTIAIDTETSGLNWVKAHSCGIVVGWGAHDNYYLPIRMKNAETENLIEQQLDIEKIREPLQSVFTDKSVTKVFWNAKFDKHFLRKDGIEVSGVIHDGVVIAHLLDENEDKRLKGIAQKAISPNAGKWEDAVDLWRSSEWSRRKKVFSDFLINELTARRAEIEIEYLNTLSHKARAGWVVVKKASKTAKLKAFLKSQPCFVHHEYADVKKESISYDFIPLDIITPYACADVHYTLMVYKQYRAALAKHDGLKKIYINEMALAELLFEVESSGVSIDVPYMERLVPQMQKKIEVLAQEIYSSIGFEFQIMSNHQLVGALLKVGCKLTKLTKAGQQLRRDGDVDLIENKHFSVDKKVMEKLATTHPFAAKIQQYKQQQKVLNTYVLGILKLVDDRHVLHTSFNQNVNTGRMSSREPNIQNIHASDMSVRRGFVVPESVGYFVFIDLSQIELRLTAHHSQDPTFLAAYPFGGEEQDVHAITTAGAVIDRDLNDVLAILADDSHPEYKNMKWYRSIGKRTNFAIGYGAGKDTLQLQISTPERPVTKEQCQGYIDGYFKKYPLVRKWVRQIHYEVWSHGYVVNSFGRIRRLPSGLSNLKWKRERAARQAVNFKIQGDAADIFKIGAVRIHKLLRKHNAKTRIVNFVHDEIQLYCPREEFPLLKEIKHAMEDFPQFTVPLRASVEFSKYDWASKKELKL